MGSTLGITGLIGRGASTLVRDAPLEEGRRSASVRRPLGGSRGRDAEAALSLLTDPISIASGFDGRGSTANGRHRPEAMRDQNVSWTVVQQSGEACFPALALRLTSGGAERCRARLTPRSPGEAKR